MVTRKMAQCDGCALHYFGSISQFFENNQASVEFLRNHGVLPSAVKCPACDADCALRPDNHMWRCRHSRMTPNSKKRVFCDFSVSDFKGTFLQNVHLPPWKVILFVTQWLSKHWDHSTVIKCLEITPSTLIKWRSICCEVTDFWFENQNSIGGAGIIVEVDETVIVHREYERGRALSQIWLLGGVERLTKKKFVIPLAGPIGKQRDNQGTLLPLVKRFVHAGSVVMTGQWGAYQKLKDHGYTHHVVDDSVDPEKPEIHIQNIELLWRDLKEWVKRKGITRKYLYQHLARHLFIKAFKEEDVLLHKFFVQAGQLYPPQSSRVRPPPPILLSNESDEEA